MKSKIILSIIVTMAAVGMWSCTQNSTGVTDVSNQTLKDAVTTSADQLSTAVSDISSSEGYQVITSGNSNLKSGDITDTGDEMFADSITLADVSGVYEYQDSSINRMQWGFHSSMYNHFKMTADTSLFIIKLPKKFVMHPSYCFFRAQDTDTLVNDFVITTSKYKYAFHFPGALSYSLGTEIDVADTVVGNLDIDWTMRSDSTPYSYMSKFAFASGYSVSTNVVRGDTTTYEYNLSNGDQTLYDEQLMWFKTDTGVVKTHTLRIGDVQIVRNSATDSVQVYKGGVLQTNATVSVVADSTSTGSTSGDSDHDSFCRKYRDYQITFDDGSTVLLSDLVGTTRDTLSQLFTSMHEMKFATHLVDYVAWNVVFRKRLLALENQ